MNIEGDISLTGKVDGVDVSQLASDVASHTGSTSNPHKVNFGQVISESLNVDFDQNEAENMAIENLASAPSSPVTGQIYFNTTDHKTYIWDGTAWQDMLGA